MSAHWSVNDHKVALDEKVATFKENVDKFTPEEFGQFILDFQDWCSNHEVDINQSYSVGFMYHSARVEMFQYREMNVPMSMVEQICFNDYRYIDYFDREGFLSKEVLLNAFHHYRSLNSENTDFHAIWMLEHIQVPEDEALPLYASLALRAIILVVRRKLVGLRVTVNAVMVRIGLRGLTVTCFVMVLMKKQLILFRCR